MFLVQNLAYFQRLYNTLLELTMTDQIDFAIKKIIINVFKNLN